MSICELWIFIIVLGAGSAGLGVCAQILDGLRYEGLSTEEARKKFVVFSHKGVLGKLDYFITFLLFFWRRNARQTHSCCCTVPVIFFTSLLAAFSFSSSI